MKKMLNRVFGVLLIACVGVLTPLKGMEPAEIEPGAIEVSVVLLNDIVKQVEKVIKVKNEKSRAIVKQPLKGLMDTLDVATREKISDDIEIILNATKANIKESVTAYRNLSDLLKAMEAQANLIKVAHEAKVLVENASVDKKNGAIDAALNKIQNATQAAQKAVRRLYSRAQNMLKLSQDNVAQRIDLLRHIVIEASVFARPEDRKVGFTWNPSDEEIREMGKKGLSRLMRSNLLDTAIRNAINSDIQILLDTTDQTLEESQKAYERLRDTIEGVDKEGKSIIAMIKEGKELIQNTPISNLQKVSDFVTVQILNAEDLLLQAANLASYSVSKLGITSLGGALLNVLMYPTTERKFIHMLNICSICKQICADKENIIGGSSMSQEEFEADRSKQKQALTDLMKDPILDEATKNAMTPDIQIILATTDETKEESKKACERLRNLTETYKPYLRKAITMAEKAIGSGLSKMGSMAQSVKDVAYNHPGTAMLISTVLVGTLIKNFKIFISNYKYYQRTYGVYDGILDATVEAHDNKDMDKYHLLMGILESLGVVVTETFNTSGKIINWNFDSPQ